MLSFITTRIWLGIVAGAFFVGLAAGSWTVWKWWGMAEMQAQIRQMKEDKRRIEVVLGLNEQIDEAGEEAEQSNQRILDEIKKRYAPSGAVGGPASPSPGASAIS